MIHIDEINNGSLRDLITANDSDILSVFHHRYDTVQCDWGYTTRYGSWAWFGGDEEEEAETSDLNIFDSYDISEIIMSEGK